MKYMLATNAKCKHMPCTTGKLMKQVDKIAMQEEKVYLGDRKMDLASKSERCDCGMTSASYGMVQSQPGMGTGDVRGS